jgi:hypothetical protein
VQQKLDDDDLIQNQVAFEGGNIVDVRCATKVKFRGGAFVSLAEFGCLPEIWLLGFKTRQVYR